MVNDLAVKALRAYKKGMARPKRFVDKTMVRFPGHTFEEIDSFLISNEDRADLIRKAVEREIAFRRDGLHAELPPFLMKGEEETDFCNNAVRKALESRRAMLATEKAERAGVAALPDSALPKSREPGHK